MSMGGSGRASDPYARKAGFDAVQSQFSSSSNNSNGKGQTQSGQQQQGQYGSWGPVFKNKSNFAEMHWC